MAIKETTLLTAFGFAQDTDRFCFSTFLLLWKFALSILNNSICVKNFQGTILLSSCMIKAPTNRYFHLKINSFRDFNLLF